MEAYITSPTSSPYVGKQLTALFHSYTATVDICCLQHCSTNDKLRVLQAQHFKHLATVTNEKHQSAKTSVQLTPRYLIMNLVLLKQLIVSSKNQVLIKILMQFSMAMHELSLVQISYEQGMILIDLSKNYIYTVHFAPVLLLHQYLPRPLVAVPLVLSPGCPGMPF